MDSPKIIQNVLDALNLTPYTLTVKMHANSNRISDILKGNCKSITPKTAKAICDAFPEISYSYLITGEGSMYADGRKSQPQHVNEKLTPSEVLRYIMQIYKLSANQLSLATGIGSGNISVLVSGNGGLKKISSMSANRIVAAFPAIRYDWARYGTGPMFNDGRTVQDLLASIDSLTDDDLVIVPKSPISKRKGYIVHREPQPKKHVVPELSLEQQLYLLKKRVADLEAALHPDMAAEDIHPDND